VYGRLTGKAAGCLGTLGPGATNLITGVADGNMDRAPMVVLTGQAGSYRQHKESHQMMDVVGMYESCTKWATPIVHPNTIPEVVRKAFKLAQREKPGACHIELAEDIAKMDAEGDPIPPKKVRRPVIDDKACNQAWEMIKNAKRPIILAGNGAIRTRAARQLRQFVNSTGIGVVSTFMGKGCVPREDPHCLFTIGLQSKDHITCAIDSADLVITLGYDLVEYHPRLWNEGVTHDILHIDFLPAEIDDNYRPKLELVGDLAHTLWMLNEKLKEEPLKFELPQQKSAREEMVKDFTEHAEDETEGSIRPQKAIYDARAALGPNDIVLSDVGAHKMWMARYYQCDEPNTCLISNGFCSMGFALPGAIAAKLVYPNRKVLAVCGDGGFLMNVQELETARRIGANIVIMVWVDGGYGLISWKQDNEFGKHTELSFNNPDLVKLAESFDCIGMYVDKSKDLKPALDEAFAADKPVVLAMPIDYRENPKLTERLGNIACAI
jgi:acetolactate synthase-1/2/3 large subunit